MVDQCQLFKKAPLATWFAAFRAFSQTVRMGSGPPPRKGLTVNLGLLPRHLSTLFKPGAASPLTVSLVIRPGQFPYRRRVPLWNQWLVSTSSSIEPPSFTEHPHLTIVLILISHWLRQRRIVVLHIVDPLADAPRFHFVGIEWTQQVNSWTIRLPRPPRLTSRCRRGIHTDASVAPGGHRSHAVQAVLAARYRRALRLRVTPTGIAGRASFRLGRIAILGRE